MIVTQANQKFKKIFNLDQTFSRKVLFHYSPVKPSKQDAYNGHVLSCSGQIHTYILYCCLPEGAFQEQ